MIEGLLEWDVAAGIRKTEINGRGNPLPSPRDAPLSVKVGRHHDKLTE
jgi:hypothetical protein